MKLIYSNGRVMEVRDVSDVILRLRATGAAALKHNGYRIVGEAEARAIVHEERAGYGIVREI